MEYIQRSIEPYLQDKLGKGKAIVIYGPRQAGKTTLARRLLSNYTPEEIVQFQTDDPSQAALFSPQVDILRRIVAGKKVLFIDEAQTIENAGLVLKLIVDTFPEVQVIATGSSSFELSDKVKESMVGRVYSVTLLPLSADELTGSDLGRLRFDLTRSMQLGSYPEVTLSDDIHARDLLRTIVDSYLYKDILSLADTRNPAVLRKLLTALALQVGQEVSFNELATLLEVSRTTIERYIYLLEQCFVVFRLDPLSSNPRKLLASRKRKVYFYDLGVRNVLASQLDIPLPINQQIGGIFENFCILERLKARLNYQQYANVYYWRSPDSEIDYLEQYGGGTHAYEIKWNKIQKSAPPRFKEQFPNATFTSITRNNFWNMIDGRKEKI
jgi:predicted AAA+ superfamily ATPase